MTIKGDVIDYLIERAKKENVEIEIEANADGERITVRPFKPFSYACPYRVGGEDT